MSAVVWQFSPSRHAATRGSGGIWLERLSAGADHVHLAEGEYVFRAGQNPTIALLRSGVVRTFLTTQRRRQLTMRYARAGDLIGVTPFLAGTADWNAEAMTAADVMVLTVEQIKVAAGQHPDLPWRIAEHLATWTAESMRSIADDAGQPMQVRVARHLREVSLRAPDGRLVAHISHRRLADAVGTVREVVGRELAELETSGVIDSPVGSISVIDEARLACIADGRPPGVDDRS